MHQRDVVSRLSAFLNAAAALFEHLAQVVHDFVRVAGPILAEARRRLHRCDPIECWCELTPADAFRPDPTGPR